MSENSNARQVETLCPACGLCCNGVIFADVELRKGDDAARLASLGLKLKKKGRGKLAFAQPCGCFDGKLCAIYADRPGRCRAFECGLLRRVQAGEMEPGAALATIARTKKQVGKVRGLLLSLGQTDETLSLTRRYVAAMSAPIELADGESGAANHGELMMAVDELMQRLQRDFLA